MAAAHFAIWRFRIPLIKMVLAVQPGTLRRNGINDKSTATGAPIVRARRVCYATQMRAASKMAFAALSLLLSLAGAQAAEQSRLPADQAVQQNVSRALIQAGIDPRRTSVQVVTTSDHVIYLSGLISDRDTIRLAGAVAARTAPSWRVVNGIRASFFDDPNHVSADKTK